MLCNKCGHHRDLHDENGCEVCACRGFVPPGDAYAYESTDQLIRSAVNETRELVAALPEELFTLRKKCRQQDAALAAATALADAVEAGDREPIEAALKQFRAAMANP